MEALHRSEERRESRPIQGGWLVRDESIVKAGNKPNLTPPLSLIAQITLARARVYFRKTEN